jgi:hypothetical protein
MILDSVSNAATQNARMVEMATTRPAQVDHSPLGEHSYSLWNKWPEPYGSVIVSLSFSFCVMETGVATWGSPEVCRFKKIP